MERKALKLALEALDDPAILNGVNNSKFFITQALAQPVQKHVSAAEIQRLRYLVDSKNLDKLYADLHIVEEICEFYAKCDLSVEALRDWVAERVDTPPLPVQEPVAYYHPQKGFYFAKPTNISAPTIVDVEPLALYTTPPLPEERNFCPRCGKRTADIHTCTPPRENT